MSTERWQLLRASGDVYLVSDPVFQRWWRVTEVSLEAPAVHAIDLLETSGVRGERNIRVRKNKADAIRDLAK